VFRWFRPSVGSLWRRTFEQPGYRRLGLLAIAVIGLVAIAYHDGRLGGPPTQAEAAAAVLRSIAESSAESADVVACVACGDNSHPRDFPPGYIDDLFSRFPGLRPISACGYDARKMAFFVREPRKQISMVACEAEDEPPVAPAQFDTARVQCVFIGGGGLNGEGRNYAVSRSLLGAITVEDLGRSWIS
jgi:hypothetical protein